MLAHAAFAEERVIDNEVGLFLPQVVCKPGSRGVWGRFSACVLAHAAHLYNAGSMSISACGMLHT